MTYFVVCQCLLAWTSTLAWINKHNSLLRNPNIFYFRNLRKNNKFRSKLVSSGLDKHTSLYMHTSLDKQTQQLTIESVHYGCVIFIVQAPGFIIIKPFTSVIYRKITNFVVSQCLLAWTSILACTYTLAWTNKHNSLLRRPQGTLL